MRLATFNILNGWSPDDRRFDADRYADAVALIDADVLALQEVDRAQPRSGHADLTALAAEAIGATHHRFVAAVTGSPSDSWRRATGDEPAGSTAYGIALLSRHPVMSWQTVRLPPLPGRVPWRMRSGRFVLVHDEPRVAVVALVDTPVGRLRVVCTHLSFLRWWNAHQLRVLLRRLGPGEEPLVLMGDLNMLPAEAQRITGMRSLADGATYPWHAPSEQIDHLLVRGDLSGHGGPVGLPMSDHHALVAEVG